MVMALAESGLTAVREVPVPAWLYRWCGRALYGFLLADGAYFWLEELQGHLVRAQA